MVKDVLYWMPPMNALQIQSFLGLAGYYRRFIKDFSKIASFEELKKRLTSALVLILLDITKKFDIYCDASHQGLGCVLMQDEKVASYASR
jgi:hypothetical protein